MHHLMLDFETLGNQPDTAVLSLGAVLFNQEKITAEKLWVFDLHGQLDVRRSVNADTLKWWFDQSEAAKNVMAKCLTEGILLKDFVPQFLEFAPATLDARVWGNGATFDVSIVENILKACRAKLPWKFFNVRCYRTMKACFGIDRKFEGTKHNALDDARHQATCLIEYWKTNPAACK